MDIPWEDLQLFLAVAEGGSMSAAARALKLGQPTLSRRMALLEERLGDPLFVRGTLGVTPTPLAERLLPAARRMAEWAADAGRAAAGRERSPEGRVRIAAPPGVAFDLLAPLAAALRTRAPGVHLEVLAGVEYVSLARGDADLAIRSRAPSEHDLAGLAEIKVRAAAYVAKSYARRLPRKVTLADLDWIAWAPPHEQTTPNPQLSAMLGERFRPVFTSNDYLVQLAALEAGVGAMLLGDRYHRLSRIGDLHRLPLDLGPAAAVTFHLVAAKRMVEVPRIRSVVEAILDVLDDKAAARRR
jgi:DNA-binding transcriptional LysR family regulator